MSSTEVDYGRSEKIIGGGSYGTIAITTTGFICKAMPITRSYSFLAEVIYPSLLDHPTIIKYHQFEYDDHHFYIFMDRYNGDLTTLPRLDWNEYRSITSQLISGLAYMTSHHLAHQDIKPANIFWRIDQNKDQGKYSCVYADFGIATTRDYVDLLENWTIYGLYFRAPELLTEYEHRRIHPTEIWALGCTLYVVYAKKYLFSGWSEESIYAQIIDKIAYAEGFRIKDAPFDALQTRSDLALVDHPEFNRLLVSMLQFQPGKRPTIFELQSHSVWNSMYPSIAPPSTYTKLGRTVPSLNLDAKISILPRHHEQVLKWIYRIFEKSTVCLPTYFVSIETFYQYLYLYPDTTEDAYSKIILGCAYLSALLSFETKFTSYLEQNYQKLFEESISKTAFFLLKKLGYQLPVVTRCDCLLSLIDNEYVQEDAVTLLRIISISFALYSTPGIVTWIHQLILRSYSLDHTICPIITAKVKQELEHSSNLLASFPDRYLLLL